MERFDKTFSGSYFRILKDHEKEFFDSFYELFTSSPEVKEKFENTDMDKQKKMLKQSIHHILDFFIVNRISPEMERIAELHSKSKHNIEPHFYDLWIHCLIDTVGKYDPQFNDDVELAWRMVISSGITYMKFRYNSD